MAPKAMPNPPIPPGHFSSNAYVHVSLVAIYEREPVKATTFPIQTAMLG